MDAFLDALADEPFRMGVTFAVLFTALILVGAMVLNKWKRWYVSGDLVEVERKRADAAEASADTRIVAMRDELTKRMDNFRSDLQRSMDQMREDHDQAFDRQADTYKAVIAAKDHDIEFLRTAWHLADQGGSEEMMALIRKIEAHMSATGAHMAMNSRFFTAFQQQTGVPQLMPSNEDAEGGLS